MPLEAFRLSLITAQTERKLTDKEAAAAIGVSLHTWQAYCRGKRVPRVSRLPLIVAKFGPGPVNALLEGTGHICQRDGRRDEILRRWVGLAEAFLDEVRKAQAEE